jgi:hypothetical protein
MLSVLDTARPRLQALWLDGAPEVHGDRSALAVMWALRARGYDLLIPFGENTRYGLVIDDGERLAKVQCKTGRVRQ